MPIRLIDQIVGHFGNAHRLAKALNVSPQTAYRWRDQGYIPARYASGIAWHTYGDITEAEVEKEASDVIKILRIKEKLGNG